MSEKGIEALYKLAGKTECKEEKEKCLPSKNMKKEMVKEEACKSKGMTKKAEQAVYLMEKDAQFWSTLGKAITGSGKGIVDAGKAYFKGVGELGKGVSKSWKGLATATEGAGLDAAKKQFAGDLWNLTKKVGKPLAIGGGTFAGYKALTNNKNNNMA